jgi:hypothetical protein
MQRRRGRRHREHRVRDLQLAGCAVDSLGAPTGVDALYVTDGRAIYAVTLSATGMTRSWRTFPATTATWVQQ